MPAGTATSTPLPRANGKSAKWLSSSIGPGSSSPGAQADSISNLNDTTQSSKEVPSKNGRPRRSMSIGALDLLSLQPSNTSPASAVPVQSAMAAAALSAPSISISSSPFAPQPDSSAALPLTAPTTTTTVAGRSRRLLPLGSGGGLRADAAGADPNPPQEVPSDGSGGAIKKKRFGGKRSQSSGTTLNSAQHQGDDVVSTELRISSSRSSSASGSTTRTTTTTTTSGSVGRASVGSATRDPFALSSSSSSAATGGGVAEGRLARGLRKTRSGLKLFGRARDQEAGAATSAQSSSTVERTQLSSHRPSIGSTESLASASTATGDAESIRELQQRELQPPLASSNRLGGWFTSLIPSANATTDARSPDKARRAAADQGTPGRTRGGSAPAATGSPTPASPARRAGQPSSSSPLKKGSSSSASIGGGAGGRLGPFDRMLDRAVQYFLDSDANTDRCEDDIWLLGVRHDGWREDAVDDEDADHAGGKRSRSPVKARAPAIPARGDENDVFAAPASTTIHGWPATFYRDFYSRIGLTYRSGFPVIECEPPASPANGAGGVMHGMLSNLSMSIGRGAQRFANVAAQADSSEPRGLSSDTGWGCMLRTGQSLLANALVKVHLGRGTLQLLP